MFSLPFRYCIGFWIAFLFSRCASSSFFFVGSVFFLLPCVLCRFFSLLQEKASLSTLPWWREIAPQQPRIFRSWGAVFSASLFRDFLGSGVQSTYPSFGSKRDPRTGVALVETLATGLPFLIIILGWNAISTLHSGNWRDPSFGLIFQPPFFSGIRVFLISRAGFFCKTASHKSDPAVPRKNKKTPPPFPDFSAASLDLFPESPDHLAPCEPVGAHFFHLGFFDEFFRHLAGATVSRPG